MTSNFSSFVILAEMRTGSNFLEANLNALDGVVCYGEAFNPVFIGYPNKEDILGVSLAEREKEPGRLLAAIRQTPEGLGGFRYFHDHDPRILEDLLSDESCAKIILNRNPLDSYISWKIAQATGQWKLTNVKARKAEQVSFDAEEFAAHVDRLQRFQLDVLGRLQASGQTPFFVAYEDLQSLDVMNGLAKWLGVSAQLEALDSKMKPQNPDAITAKVSNPEVMEAALGGMDRFNMTRIPNFEPRRGPSVPSYFATERAPLLFQPIPGGPNDQVVQWLSALDGVGAEGLRGRLNQKELRNWKQQHVGFRSFAVLRHPLARVHRVFCEQVLMGDPKALKQIRQAMKGQFKLNLPKCVDGALVGYELADHRAAFEKFLAFVKANLSGQTGVRVDVAWASQREILNGFGEVASPDLLLREDELPTELPHLARRLGCEDALSQPEMAAEEQPFALAEIYDAELEAMCRGIYKRDYLNFGFGDWRPLS